MGQAWYGLGDMNNAKTNLQKSIRFFGVHSQANLTMCAILKSEGKTQEAIEALKKSIEENYTTEKEAELNKLGDKLTYDDIKLHWPLKAEPLGIEGFFNAIPEYAFQGGEVANSNKLEWDEFIQNLDAKAKPLEAEKKQLEVRVKNYSNQLLANPNLLLKPYNYNNYVHKTVSRKYALLTEWATDRLVALDKKRTAAMDSVKKWKEEYNKAWGNATSCEVKFDLATQFNTKANSLWQAVNSQLLSFMKQDVNARSNLYLYVTTDQSMYDLEIVNIKLGVLNFLSDLHHEFEVGCFPTEEQKKPGGKKLLDFDSVNCQYHDEFSIGYFTRFKFECNKMTTKFHLGLDFNYGPEVSPYLDYSLEENLNTSQIVKQSLEIGAEIGADKLLQQGGIHEAEAKAEGAIGVEWSHGHLEGHGEISNYQNVAGVESELKWNAGDEKISSSIEGKFEGKGFLQGIHLSTGPISLK
jgi:hypothetical protein